MHIPFNASSQLNLMNPLKKKKDLHAQNVTVAE